jgi:hypothetical protein
MTKEFMLEGAGPRLLEPPQLRMPQPSRFSKSLP